MGFQNVAILGVMCDGCEMRDVLGVQDGCDVRGVTVVTAVEALSTVPAASAMAAAQSQAVARRKGANMYEPQQQQHTRAPGRIRHDK